MSNEIMPYETEVWRPSPSFSPLEASSLGRCRQVINGNAVVLPEYGPARNLPYKTVQAKPVTRNRRVYVHQVVADAFLGPKPTPELHVNHIDGNPLNNRPENLEYVTAKGNVLHAIAIGRRWYVRGEAHGMARLNGEAVTAARRAYRRGATLVELAARFGVSKSALQYAIRGRTWRHLAEPPVPGLGRGRTYSKAQLSEDRR